MSAQSRSAWALGAALLAALSVGLRAPDAAWAACLLAAPAAWRGLREWAGFQPGLAGLALVAAAAAAAAGRPEQAAASLAVAAAGADRPLGRLAAVSVGLAGAVWILEGRDAGLGVLAAACGACALVQVSETVAHAALARAARRGVFVARRDALQVAAGIDGVVLALPACTGTEALRAVGCEVWQRGGNLVPLQRRADRHAFAVADMLARGRRVAVVAGPGARPLTADLTVQAGGGPGADVVLANGRIEPLADFLRLARRVRRSRGLLGAAALLTGGPGAVWAALGGLPPAAAAWTALAAAALLAVCGAAAAAPPIFTSLQRPYG